LNLTNLVWFLAEFSIAIIVAFFFAHYLNMFLFEKTSNPSFISNIGTKTVGFKKWLTFGSLVSRRKTFQFCDNTFIEII